MGMQEKGCHLNCVSKSPFEEDILLLLVSRLHTVLVTVFIGWTFWRSSFVDWLNHNHSSFCCWFSLVSVAPFFQWSWWQEERNVYNFSLEGPWKHGETTPGVACGQLSQIKVRVLCPHSSCSVYSYSDSLRALRKILPLEKHKVLS